MLLGKKTSGVEWLIAGLGNPGEKYARTRHNMGFLTADLLAEREHVKIDRIKFKAVTAQVTFGGHRCLLMKPQTYMNLSGEAVREAAQFYKIPAEHVLVIYDDVSLPVGKIRVRPSGSAGGHNGIKNIIAQLGTEEFPRVKIGTGAPSDPERDMIGWVIGEPSQQDKKLLLDAFGRAVDAAERIIEDGGCQRAMNQFN
ncbi:MAG: aminoacyl-tRNA hydrolase [Oscillibacter sp.]|jgi:PTH1 family peptidyl-tRNA hydrolase|nr:aminoacyl-tRNA hydrolase [Oscillibacter sp.]